MSTEKLPAEISSTPHASGGLPRWLQSPWPAAVLACLCFANSLPNDLVYDDEHHVVNKQSIRSLTNFRGIWLTDWIGSPPEGEARLQPDRDLMYRPLVDFTFAINYALHGLEPWGFRLVNILLHVLATVLVWHFAQRLFGDTAISCWTALLFATHPLHCEPAIYICARAESLAAIFMLLGLLVLLPRGGVADLRRALRAAPLFLLAMLSKESAICYMPVVLIVFFALRRQAGRISAAWWFGHLGVLLLPLVVYMPLRWVSLGGHLSGSEPFSMLNPLVDASLWERIFTPFTILGHYARLFLWPMRLSTEYGLAVINPKAGPDAMTWLGLVAALGLLVGLVGYLCRRGAWERVATLSAIWLASYFLISNTLILFATPLAERLMYWPSVPVFLMMAMAGTGLWRRLGRLLRLKPGAYLIIGCTLGGLVVARLGARCVGRGSNWATSIRLFTKDADTYPQCAKLNGNAAMDYYLFALECEDKVERRRNLERADAYYAQALRIFPNHSGFLLHRSEIMAKLGDLGGAIEYARQACRLKPQDIDSRLLLAQALVASGQRHEGVELYRQIQDQLPPNHPLRPQIEQRIRSHVQEPTTRDANAP